MGKIMLNSELYGVGVEANPTVPEGTTPTSLTGLKIDKNYYNVSGGGGGGNLTFKTLYDSGSQTVPAANNVAHTYIDNELLTDYDFIIVAYSGDRGINDGQTLYSFLPVNEIINDTLNEVSISGYADRYVLVRFNVTNFNISISNVYGIYKIIGVKM